MQTQRIGKTCGALLGEIFLNMYFLSKNLRKQNQWSQFVGASPAIYEVIGTPAFPSSGSSGVANSLAAYSMRESESATAEKQSLRLDPYGVVRRLTSYCRVALERKCRCGQAPLATSVQHQAKQWCVHAQLRSQHVLHSGDCKTIFSHKSLY